jgi:hypothetical protein
VQDTLHVSGSYPSAGSATPTVNHRWDFCSDFVNNHWVTNDYLGDTTELYKTIYNHPHKPAGFKMLVFSGDVDGVRVVSQVVYALSLLFAFGIMLISTVYSPNLRMRGFRHFSALSYCVMHITTTVLIYE